MTLSCKNFNDLSNHELYEILYLRNEVFVVEQNCVYQDADYKDQFARHCQGIFEGKLAAYTRIFDLNQNFQGYLSIGRVIVSPDCRRYGFGKEIMKYSIAQCYLNFGIHPIKISAQSYLHEFYTELGFEATGEHYMEDGLPHQSMIKPVNN